MELQEFVAQALSQIIQGVKSVQQTSSEVGATINPGVPNRQLEEQGYLSTGGILGEQNSMVLFVEFDTAVTITEGEGVKASAGISILAANVGFNLGTKDESSTVSRIKFKVPIVLPPQLPPQK